MKKNLIHYFSIRAFKKVNWFVVLIMVVGLSVYRTSAYAESFVVTNPPSIQKVLPVAGEAGPEADTLRIAMARGEYEPVQIVIQAAGKPLRGIRVSVSKLVGTKGSSLPQEQITVNPVGYIRCNAPTRGKSPLLKYKGGEVPDVLLPDRPMDVPKQRRQPYYITVRALRTDQAGEYRGTVRVAAEGEKAREIPLVVRVYDIVLPVKSHLNTGFGLDAGYRKIEGADPAKDMDSLLRYSKFMLEHRISPRVYGSSYSRTKLPPKKLENGKWNFSGMDRYLSELVPLGLTTFYTHAGAGYRPYAEHLKKRGWFELAHVYMFDEAPMHQLPNMLNQYKYLSSQVPGVKILQVGWSPTKSLEGLVNIWCPLLSHADTLALQEARERGEETWWYTWDGPGRPYPNICHVDDPGIYTRITGWMTYYYRIQGFLYWSIDIWDTPHNRPAGGRLSVDEYDRANYANWDPNTVKKTSYGSPRNGDGWLIYPGKGNVPIASMRLALVRDGFEDYDLFKEVEALAIGEGKTAVRAQELLEFATPFDKPIILSLRNWTKVDNILMHRREAILKVAEELRQPNNQRLRDLREKTTLDTLYPLPVEKEQIKFAFGATPPAKARYVDGTECLALVPKLREVAKLPLDGWLFKDDPKKVGVEKGYYKPGYPAGDLAKVKIGEFWDHQGYEGLEEGWYRLRYKCPELPKGKQVFLHFVAVDESAWLYVDGKPVAWYDTVHPSITWVKPFLLNVTGNLKSRGEHLLAIRVRNTRGAGGIYKPVSLMVEK